VLTFEDEEGEGEYHLGRGGDEGGASLGLPLLPEGVALPEALGAGASLPAEPGLEA
jgi:hypothetical protein